MSIDHIELASEVNELLGAKCFSDHICRLLRGLKIRKNQVSLNKSFSNKMTIDLNVPSSFVKNWVSGIVHSSLTATK